MRREMAEQPRNLRDLVDDFDATAAQVAHLVRGGIAGVAFLARGSSDNAALLGRYATEIESGRPTSLIAPSVSTAFGRGLEHFADWLVVALSQSGQTPEIVRLATEAKHAGARVVALTNDPTSSLARTADLAVDLRSGPELAVPATKSVTSQMLGVLAVAAGLSTDGRLSSASFSALPGDVDTLLADPAYVRAATAIADDIAALPPAQRSAVLEKLRSSGKSAVAFLERHPKTLLTAAGVTAFLATKDELLQAPTIAPDGTRTGGGIVHTVWHDVFNVVKSPLGMAGTVLVALAAGWAALRLWHTSRRLSIKRRAAEIAALRAQT
jgi:hypothetical protein